MDYEYALEDASGGEIKVSELGQEEEEVGFMLQRRIWTERPLSECWTKTGKGPVSVRCVDVNMGSQKEPMIRCRLVARDSKGK